jgi:hypothetical protein
MFGKKPAAPPPAQPKPQAPPAPQPSRPSGWLVQALTADYVVSGYMPPVPDMPLVGHLNNPAQPTIVLANAQLQTLLPQAAVANAAPMEVTLPKASLIALIPRDEAGMRSAAMQMPNRAERVIIYAGPYVLRAAFMLTGEMPLRNFFGAGGGTLVAVTEAEVACPTPGAQFAPLKTPILVLNKAQVQLYHPA